jgi:hypothetical protein
MKISLFPHAKQPLGKQVELPWGEFVEYSSSFSMRSTKDGELYSLAEYEEDNIKRANSNVKQIWGAVIDYDNLNRNPTDIIDKYLNGYACCYHSTYSNQPWVKKWRLIIPFSEPVSPEKWRGVWDYIYDMLGSDEAIDKACKDPSRAYYAPACTIENKNISFHGSKDGHYFIPKEKIRLKEVNYEPMQIPKDEVGEALSYIPSDNYSMWVEIGMALKDELGGAGFNYFDNWSRKAPNYDSTDKTRKKWDSFKSTGITAGTLYYHAIQAGWIPKPPEEDYIPTIPVNIKPIEEKQIDIVGDAPNLVGQVKDYILNSAIYPQPNLALAAAISLVGTFMAHKVQGNTGLRTNMYTMGLAPSGSGKEHPRQCNIGLLREVGMEKSIIGELVSGAGLLYAIADSDGRALHQIDEVGRYLGTIKNKNASSYQQEIPKILIELFSQSSSIYTGKQYSKRNNPEERVDIDQPCLSIFATTVPDRFYENISPEEIMDGFLTRWLIFEADEYIIEGNEGASKEIPSSLYSELTYWVEHTINPHKRGNLDINPNPLVVGNTEEAESLVRALNIDIRTKIKDSEYNQLEAAIWARCAEHARKLALIGHVSGQVDVDVMRWAIEVAKHSANNLCQVASDNLTSNENEREVQKVLNWIRSQRKWVTRSDITRATQWLNKRRRNEIVSDLVEGRLVEFKEETSEGKKPIQLFR